MRLKKRVEMTELDTYSFVLGTLLGFVAEGALVAVVFAFMASSHKRDL
jgi:hypothetical protein